MSAKSSALSWCPQILALPPSEWFIVVFWHWLGGLLPSSTTANAHSLHLLLWRDVHLSLAVFIVVYSPSHTILSFLFLVLIVFSVFQIWRTSYAIGILTVFDSLKSAGRFIYCCFSSGNSLWFKWVLICWFLPCWRGYYAVFSWTLGEMSDFWLNGVFGRL